MSDAPLVEMAGVVKQYGADEPLRVERFTAGRDDRVVIAGLDAVGAEMFVHLVTGAALPDEGDVRVGGRRTHDIATDTDWLASLDQFGLVTSRAVLLDGLSIASNLALPLTLEVDPLDAATRMHVDRMAAEVGLAAVRVAAPARSLTPDERVRVHLARALASGPTLVLLEHPTEGLTPVESRAFGATLKRVSEAKRVGWIAFSQDAAFARASGARRMTVEAATGQLNLDEDRRWTRFLFRR